MRPTVASADPAAEARAAIARHRLRLYKVAARLDFHPANLGSVLSGRRPITEEFAARLMRAIADEAAASK